MEKWEKEILRSLGKRIAEIAALPRQQEIRRRWYEHNSLKRGKPMVLYFRLFDGILEIQRWELFQWSISD